MKKQPMRIKSPGMCQAKFEVLEEGWVTRRDPSKEGQAGGAPCALTSQGDGLCSYATQSKMAANDFQPMLARPVIMGAPGKTIDRFGRSWQRSGPSLFLSAAAPTAV